MKKSFSFIQKQIISGIRPPLAGPYPYIIQYIPLTTLKQTSFWQVPTTYMRKRSCGFRVEKNLNQKKFENPALLSFIQQKKKISKVLFLSYFTLFFIHQSTSSYEEMQNLKTTCFLRNNWPNALLMIFISSPPRNKSSIFHGLCHNHHCQRQAIISKVQHKGTFHIFFSVTDFKSSKLRFQLMLNPQCGRRCVFFSHSYKQI